MFRLTSSTTTTAVTAVAVVLLLCGVVPGVPQVSAFRPIITIQPHHHHSASVSKSVVLFASDDWGSFGRLDHDDNGRDRRGSRTEDGSNPMAQQPQKVPTPRTNVNANNMQTPGEGLLRPSKNGPDGQHDGLMGQSINGLRRQQSVNEPPPPPSGGGGGGDRDRSSSRPQSSSGPGDRQREKLERQDEQLFQRERELRQEARERENSQEAVQPITTPKVPQDESDNGPPPPPRRQGAAGTPRAQQGAPGTPRESAPPPASNNNNNGNNQITKQDLLSSLHAFLENGLNSPDAVLHIWDVHTLIQHLERDTASADGPPVAELNQDEYLGNNNNTNGGPVISKQDLIEELHVYKSASFRSNDPLVRKQMVDVVILANHLQQGTVSW